MPRLGGLLPLCAVRYSTRRSDSIARSGHIAADLTTLDPTVFDHARFFEGLSELNSSAAGTNVVLVWVDDRHSNGIFDPRPEIYLDTAWY